MSDQACMRCGFARDLCKCSWRNEDWPVLPPPVVSADGRVSRPPPPTRPRAPLRLATLPANPKPAPEYGPGVSAPPASPQEPQRPWQNGTEQELAEELTRALHEGERILVMTFRANDVDGVTLNTAVFVRDQPRVSWLEFLATLQIKLSAWFAKGFLK